MSTINSAMTTVVLANACELVYSVFISIAGNDVSNSLDGKPLNREMVNNIVLAEINNNLSKSMGGA